MFLNLSMRKQRCSIRRYPSLVFCISIEDFARRFRQNIHGESATGHAVIGGKVRGIKIYVFFVNVLQVNIDDSIITGQQGVFITVKASGNRDIGGNAKMCGIKLDIVHVAILARIKLVQSFGFHCEGLFIEGTVQINLDGGFRTFLFVVIVIIQCLPPSGGGKK